MSKIQIAERCRDILNRLRQLYKEDGLNNLSSSVLHDCIELNMHINEMRSNGFYGPSFYVLPKRFIEKYGPHYDDFKGIFKGLTFKKRDL